MRGSPLFAVVDVDKTRLALMRRSTPRPAVMSRASASESPSETPLWVPVAMITFSLDVSIRVSGVFCSAFYRTARDRRILQVKMTTISLQE